MKPGPAPKRDDERRRTNSPEHTKLDQSDLPFEVNLEPTIPEANERWHPIARDMFESLKTSPSRLWMYDADWAWAYVLAEGLSRDLGEQIIHVEPGHWIGFGESREYIEPVFHKGFKTLPGASINAYVKAFAGFGVTEADRLRMQLEVPPVGGVKDGGPVEDPDGVVHSINEARERRLG